jgi:AcrR family transcriptional regulator
MTKINQTKAKNLSTRDKIIGIAEQLFTKYSYGAVSMNDIANMVKTTKAALYYHFKSKEDLFTEVLNDAFEDFSSHLEEILKKKISLDKKFRELLVTYINFSLKKRDLAKLMMQKLSKKDKKIIRLLRDLKKSLIYQIEPIVKEIMILKGHIKKADSRLITLFLIGALNALITSEIITPSGNWQAEQVADQVTSLVFNDKVIKY